MNWKIFNQPLGVSAGETAGTVKKEMPIPLAVPLVLGAASAFSSIWGGKKSAEANKKAADALAAEKAQLAAERMRIAAQDWSDTKSGQNTIRILKDQDEREFKRDSGAAAVAGATDAAVAQGKEMRNLRQAEMIAQAEANHEARKDAQVAQLRQAESGITQQEIAADRAQGQAVADAAGGVASALGQGAVATLGGTKLGQQWMGGSTAANAPATVTPPGTLQQMGKNYRTIEDLYKQSYSGWT